MELRSDQILVNDMLKGLNTRRFESRGSNPFGPILDSYPRVYGSFFEKYSSYFLCTLVISNGLDVSHNSNKKKIT